MPAVNWRRLKLQWELHKSKYNYKSFAFWASLHIQHLAPKGSMMWTCLAANLHISKSCDKIQNTVDQETPVCLASSSTLQHLSYLYIVQLWWPTCQCEQTWKFPLQCMMAVDILLILNTYTHLATFQHSRAQSFNASCSSACHYCRFNLENCYLHIITLLYFTDFHFWMINLWEMCMHSYTHMPSPCFTPFCFNALANSHILICALSFLV